VDRTEAKKLVEEALRKFGVDPASVNVKDEPAQSVWSLKRGSAAVLVSLFARGEKDALRIVAPVVYFDEARKNDLFPRLLELNTEGLQSCAFGLVKDLVICVGERPLAGLDLAEVEHIIEHVAAVADTYDDRLVAEFGGRRASDKA
jgi:hypothetical protein